MVTVFETVVSEKAQDEAAEKSQSTNSQSSTTTQAPNTSGQLRLGTNDEAVIHFVGTCQQDINAAHEKLKMFIKKSMARKVIDNEKIYEVIIQHFTEVKQLSEKQDVLVTCSPSKEASIEGMVGDVSDCKDELTCLLANYEEKEREENRLDQISQYVQWSFYDGAQSVMYDKQSNGNIETAFRDDKSKLFHFTRNGIEFEIHFTAKTEKNQQNGQVVNITRTRSDESLPAEWDRSQPPNQVVHLVSLSQSSSEYQQVLNHFTSKGGTSQQIKGIERIQNPGLYKAYLAKKQSMNGEENEMQLFHGTNADNTQSINVNNFNRIFSGINGVKFGKGVYFARDASYSLGYAQPGSSNYRQMYVAKVLVGKYTTGAKGMKAPPSRNDPANPGLLYDSVVNNIHHPSIFVIFLDHQCYPEHLITFF